MYVCMYVFFFFYFGGGGKYILCVRKDTFALACQIAYSSFGPKGTVDKNLGYPSEMIQTCTHASPVNKQDLPIGLEDLGSSMGRGVFLHQMITNV